MKNFLMGTMAAALMVSCASDGALIVPKDTLEECVYMGEKTQFAVWAPDAEAAQLKLYNTAEEETPFKTVDMMLGKDGLWKTTVKEDVKGTFYTFQVKKNGQWLEETAGIAAKAVGVNGWRGAVIDWNETDPEGWAEDKSPQIAKSDIIVYEMHHRDFSIHQTSGVTNKGKYLALTEEGTKNPDGLATGIDHLKEIGVTYIQLLPSTDFITVDETHLENNQYNWGYDPFNYNAVEGSYSTDPYNPVTRIKEFKQMIQALHKAGFRVILDVVYNHTTDASKTGFERTMPGYFYRMREDGTFFDGSGCGNETASEQAMFQKYMLESLEWWMKEYHIDGFRFDLMAIHDIETMNLISERLHAIDPEVVSYGEGWAAQAPAYPAEQIALKSNTYMLDKVGAFSDNIRDAVRGPLGCENAGFMDGVEGNEDNVKFGIAGGVEHPQVAVERWTANPLQHISYVSCHDDHCLRDRLEEATDATEAERLAMVKLAQTAVYTSQGIPFIFAGEELYRHKQGVKNSYNQPDSINAIDWTYKTQYKDLVDYYAGLAAIRHAHPGFCLGDAELVREKLEFIDVEEPCVVAFRVNNLEGIDSAKSLTVLLNGSKKPVAVNIPEGQYVVLAQNGQADAEGLSAYSGSTISASATSATILAEM
ncbi:MAG: type I pullulanase [Bacteroidales bacterium]|nr:type I pullulanase [Bacteroidales bacterium]MBR5862722.1 type I pullulanase [Bacteroidales bacterium]